MKSRYFEKFEHATELDLLKNEYEFYLNGDKTGSNFAHTQLRSESQLSLLTYKRFLNGENLEFFKLQDKRKIEFLEEEIDKLGYLVNIDYSGETARVSFFHIETEAEKELNLKGLPDLTVRQRYAVFQQLGFRKRIDEWDLKSKDKYDLMAVILNINPDNAKKLYGNTYKQLTSKDDELLSKFLDSKGFNYDSEI
ncbi:MAG: hypothetical protein HRT71_17070 [Flavobacteriales bacterium]|nr:hypothetical protein [Flavobacteriales bacterium]